MRRWLFDVQVSGVGACRAWHFGTFAAWFQNPYTPPRISPTIWFSGYPASYAGKVTPLNGSQMPSALHTRVCKFRKYPLSVSFVWDLFVPFFGALSACANLQNLKIKYNEKITKLLHPQLSIRKLCSMRCFDHISTQFVRYIHKLPPHKCALYLFPGEKKGCDSL